MPINSCIIRYVDLGGHDSCKGIRVHVSYSRCLTYYRGKSPHERGLRQNVNEALSWHIIVANRPGASWVNPNSLSLPYGKRPTENTTSGCRLGIAPLGTRGKRLRRYLISAVAATLNKCQQQNTYMWQSGTVAKIRMNAA